MKIKVITIILLSLAFVSGELIASERKEKITSPLGTTMEKYENVPGFTYTKIGKLLLGIAKASIDDDMAGKFMNKVETIYGLDIDKTASAKDRDRFIKEADNILKDYIKVVEMTEEGDKMTFYIDKIAEGSFSFKEIIIVGIEESTIYMAMTGHFDKETMDEIAAKDDKTN